MKILDVPQSGSLAGQTSSHNRYGQYRRTRSIPVNPSTAFQQTVRSRMQLNSAAYRNLTAEQRNGWIALGASMTRTDSLGQVYTLTGAQAHASINNTRLAAGDAVVTDAPGLTTPDPITLGTVTLTALVHTIAYTPTPLAAGERLFVFTSQQRSAGRSFENDIRLVHVSAAAAASPADIETAFNARFGVPVVGNRVFYSVSRYYLGFLSTPVATSAVVS
jgi:hypothetical protein